MKVVGSHGSESYGFDKPRILWWIHGWHQKSYQLESLPSQKSELKLRLMDSYCYMGVSRNNGIYPQIIHFNRVFQYNNINHPFWGTTIFGNTHIMGSIKPWLLWHVNFAWAANSKICQHFLGGQAASIISSPQKLSEFWSSNFSIWLMGSRRANGLWLNEKGTCEKITKDHPTITWSSKVVVKLFRSNGAIFWEKSLEVHQMLDSGPPPEIHGEFSQLGSSTKRSA